MIDLRILIYSLNFISFCITGIVYIHHSYQFYKNIANTKRDSKESLSTFLESILIYDLLCLRGLLEGGFSRITTL